MKKYFIVSLVKNGILGGGIVADSEAITYYTGKLTIPERYRHLEMKYKEICKVTTGWLFYTANGLDRNAERRRIQVCCIFQQKAFC